MATDLEAFKSFLYGAIDVPALRQECEHKAMDTSVVLTAASNLGESVFINAVSAPVLVVEAALEEVRPAVVSEFVAPCDIPNAATVVADFASPSVTENNSHAQSSSMQSWQSVLLPRMIRVLS
jgi:hypothetical protein